MAGGFTLSLPEEDRVLDSKKKLFATMVGMLGGRAAEEVIFDDITSGASSDIENVTKLARRMVTRLGMSDELGPMVYGQKEELVFLGREISEQRDYSEFVAQKIDQDLPEPGQIAQQIPGNSGLDRIREGEPLAGGSFSHHVD